MSLEHAFSRLAIRPFSLCRQCRRTFASSAPRDQYQSATAAFAEGLQASRNQSSTASAQQARAQAPPPPARQSSSPAPTPPPTSPAARGRQYEMMNAVITETDAAQRRQREQQRAAEIERSWTRADLERQAVRRWKVGDVYAPHDLTGVEQAKWKKLRRKGRQRYDVVDQLGINPIEHYKNFSMMSEYMTDMGRIKHGNETGLRPVNQRRMAKAVRRAIGTGLMPGVHRHPEILRMEMKNRRPPM